MPPSGNLGAFVVSGTKSKFSYRKFFRKACEKSSVTSSTNEPRTYDFKDIESKWLPVWDELQVFKPADDGSR